MILLILEYLYGAVSFLAEALLKNVCLNNDGAAEKRAALDAAALIRMEWQDFSMDFSGQSKESLSNDNIMVFTV